VPKNATVRFSEHDYLAGKFSVLDELRKIPGQEVRAKQRAIAAGAFKLQYAIDDLPGDAVETMMNGALGLAATLGEYYNAPLTPPPVTPRPTKRPTIKTPRPTPAPEITAESAVADAGRAAAPGASSDFFSGLGLGLLAAACAAAVVLVRRGRGRG